LALEVGLAIYALLAALLLVRVAFLAVGISELVWAGATVYALTNPLILPFTFFEVARQPLLGRATLGDLTALGLVVLVPLTLLVRDRAD